MYQKILVPLDGSSCAGTILPHVENLANCLESKVVFLQVIVPVVIPVSPEGFSYIDVEEKIQEQVTQDANTYLAKVQQDFQDKNITAEVLVEEGSVVNTILEVAERESADLIAMASHGRSGLSRVFYGSVAESLLHQVDRPLLLIRSDDGE